MNEKVEYICPDWARCHWDPNTCSIYPTMKGKFAIISPEISTCVAIGETREDCLEFLIDHGRVRR